MRIFILVFVILSTGIFTAGYFYYKNYETRYRSEIENQISAIAELKVNELVRYRMERIGDANLLYKNESFTALVRRFFKKPGDKDARRQIQIWLSKYYTLYLYDNVCLFDAHGSARISMPEVLPLATPTTSRIVAEVLRSGQVTFQDFYRNEQNQEIYLSVLVPILDEQNGSRALGVLVMYIDPLIHLYPYISRWPTPSRTAETLLIRREGNEVVFLNELRFQKNTALNLRFSLEENKEMPSVKAALGQEGIVEGIDYRGVPVFACLRAVPDSPWFIVARLDRSEVYASVRERLWILLSFMCVLLIGASMSIGFVWRRQTARFYRERYEAAKTLQEKNRQLQQAEAIAQLGNWNLNISGNRLSWSDEMYRIFGVNPADFDLTYEKMINLIHPEDRAYLEQLTETIQREEKSNFECRIQRQDETLRHIAGRVELVRNSAGEAVSIFGTVLDVTELRFKERELQVKNDDLERFTYSISHDLKSPLVTIKAFLGYLEQDIRSRDKERMDKDLTYIRGAADKMSRMLDELLEFSRVGRKMNPSTEVPLQAVVQEALDLVAGSIAERNAQVQITEEPVILYGDRLRLVEVFQNLIDNAVKYMGDQPAPRVEIGVEQDGDTIVLYVRDNGIGIDPRHQTKLFGLFEKLNPGSEGTGIGLALVRRIVEVHGGKIWAESAGPGRGATFRFTLSKTRRRQTKG